MSEATAAAWRLPTDAAIKKVLAERIERQRDGVGIVIGVVDARGCRVVAHGRPKRRSRREVGAGTLFEIGSNTKVFTSLLLRDMALRGEVAISDPVQTFLPDGVVMPARGGRQITLEDLATHSSGLPRMPTNFQPADRDNPYADYTVERLYAFLGGHTLTRDIGAEYEYSNLGAGLLGHVLGRRLGTDYERAVRARIAGPLGLSDTVMRLSADQRKRFAHGHDGDRQPVPNWESLDPIAGAGFLRSTTDDLLAFLAVALGYRDAPLKRAIDAQLAYPMREAGQPGLSVGLGWHATENEHGRTVWHNGGTGGYRTFMGLSLARGWGAVVLTNVSSSRGGDDIGQHILTGAPLAPPPKRRRAVSVAPELLDAYVGRYRYHGGSWIAIKRWGDGLAANVNDAGDAMLYAASPTTFFWKQVEAELTFETDADGRAVALVTRSAARGEHRAVRA